MSKFIQANIIEILPAVRRTATANGTGVDLSAYSGPMHFSLVSSAGGGTTPTLDVKLQESDSLASGYTDITGATFTQVTDGADACEMITLQVDEHKPFIRAVSTISGTSPTFDSALVAHAALKAGRNSSQSV